MSNPLKDALNQRRAKNELRLGTTHDPKYTLVLDHDCTTPPVTVITGTERECEDVIKNSVKKTADFRSFYRRPEEPSPSVPEAIKEQVQNLCPCDKRSQKKCLTKRFPVWRIMRKYKWRTDLPSDIVSGLTVGIMQLPQGMAYALLAELPPVVGLYMAFFPVLIYFIFGTSKHISMGTVALCSLLTGSVISRFYNPTFASTVLGTNLTNSLSDAERNISTDPSDPIEVELPNHVKFDIAASVCLLVGFVQLFMGIFRMGFITTYMSDPMIGGFTTGAAVHVGTSQVKYVFGLHIPRSDGVFQIIKTYVLIFHHIAETNVPTLIMSLVCMVIIYIIKVQINQRFKAKLKFPVPVELIVVVAGTMTSYFLNFSENYGMKIVGEIPRGLPKPSIPSLPSTSVYTADVFIIAIVAFSQCVGLAALMAKKHGYSYDANQELIAYGAGNIFGSFFSCYPYAASVSRSSVQESAGGKTQLASVFSATLVLIVIVSIGPLFQTLPNCVLASIITVALRSLFLQFLDLPRIYRTSVYDFLIWIVTFLAVVVLHVDYGILLGMLFSFFTVVIRSQRTKADNLEKLEAVQLYQDSSKFIQTGSVSGVRIIGYNSPLYYANGSLFVKQVYTLTGVIPEKKKRQAKRQLKAERIRMSQKNSTAALLPNMMSTDDSSMDRSDLIRQTIACASLMEDNLLHHIVLDLSGVSFIDSVGAKVLKQLVEDYQSVDVEVLFSNINDEVWRVMEATEFLKSYEERMYLTTDDAVDAINTKMKQANELGLILNRGSSNQMAEEDDELLTTRVSVI
ncbi:sulfate transporter-like [Mercenaria mercenaria]|uniref:sulfate transporter-like n=1 Tax=Mercenaria mercenaria TaxID=6596 RepID=UPI00234FB147|nr:sulfate transporter-like [Mercenaria mercenaria]